MDVPGYTWDLVIAHVLVTGLLVSSKGFDQRFLNFACNAET